MIIKLIALFALNMLLIWLTAPFKKFAWYRTLGVLIWLAIMIILPILPQLRFYLDFAVWRWAGVLAIMLGLIIFTWAKLEFSKRGVSILEFPKELIISGPYQYIRHPQYLGLIFMFVGWCWVWAAVYAFYFGLIILALHWLEAYLEEKLILEKIFGKDYIEYRLTTGMFWIK